MTARAPQRRWRAAASPGALIGILGLILSLLVAGGALAVLTKRTELPVWHPLLWAALVLAAVAAVAFGYLLYGYSSISYELNEDSLVIRWALRRYVVDLKSIEHFAPASEALGSDGAGWHPFWTGYYIGTEESPAGPVTVVATLPRRRQLLVMAGEQRFAISPERPVRFIQEYAQLSGTFDPDRPATSVLRMGEAVGRLTRAGWTDAYAVQSAPATDASAVSQAPSDREASPVLRPHLLADPLALGLLATAVLLNVLMVTYILSQYRNLPSSIALHWNVNGFPDVIGSPREIWTIPIITGLVTLANFGLAWSIAAYDRFAARFLLAGSGLVQIVAWVGLVTIIR